MQPSTAPTQALPALARTTQSSAAPSRGVPGGFGDALTQALAWPEPAGSAVPTILASPEVALPAQALPALQTAAATPQANPAAIDPSKPEKDEPTASATEAKEDKPFGEAAKPSEELQAPAPFEPILPTPPQAVPLQAVPLQAVPMVAQLVASPSEAGDAAPSTGQDSSMAPAAGIDGRQRLPGASAPAAAQTAAPPASAPQTTPMVAQPITLPSKAGDAAPSTGQDSSTAPAAGIDGRQRLPGASAPAAAQTAAPPASAPQATPMVAQPVALPSEAGDAAPSTGQDSSTAPAAGIDGRQRLPGASAPAAAQAAAPPASAPPSRAAPPFEAGDTAARAVQKHFASATTEEEPSAALLALPAEAAPLPPAASAPLPNAAPAPLGIAPHPAPARSPAADKPVPPPAAAQVGPALASFAASAAHPGAPQHLTIRLDPMDLGRVQVRIERSPDGSARVELKVEKPDTLLLLLRDQPQLHRALDLAGVPSTERTLQFHLAPPDATAPSSMAAQSNANGGHGQHRPGQPQFGRFAAHGAPSSGEPIPGPAAFRRAGVDITA